MYFELAINQDETVEWELCGHSDRVAIAFNFVLDSNASRIRLTKNLRFNGNGSGSDSKWSYHSFILF